MIVLISRRLESRRLRSRHTGHTLVLVLALAASLLNGRRVDASHAARKCCITSRVLYRYSLSLSCMHLLLLLLLLLPRVNLTRSAARFAWLERYSRTDHLGTQIAAPFSARFSAIEPLNDATFEWLEGSAGKQPQPVFMKL